MITKVVEKVRYPWQLGTPPELEGAPPSLNPLVFVMRQTRKLLAKYPDSAAAREAERQARMGNVFDDGEVVRAWVDTALDLKCPHKQMAQWGHRMYFSTGIPSDSITGAGYAPGLSGHLPEDHDVA